MPKDVREAVLVAADAAPYAGEVAGAIAVYAKEGHPDLALAAFRAHAALCLVDVLYREFEARIMRDGMEKP
jgi:hypothetical protein